ncbi:hypothetical protein LEP1GSC016_2728 [Leptospira borgpetersenii serovar Hardjo-bovis str. Sponselee]|uniref:Uncharacterized protein n=1 Tax=Leptospira borgpetersenii serovar Hardjo-bovis str. Sponselee TaxID=1303729 RepID=M6BRB2_LEPBO|nr:hypothetical protein LBK6_01095 [Leptospira borgpetersenii serovar Hardjo]AWV68965.1 hypothetical protein B9T54_01210 [Leptospira borgpetersenii serovar Hardjo-bovis]EMJ82024.1 hypothetical protein LEP1GSC016_2728 [Leptospira borgpetersenii serovar Hardjo-bovis str. Sponselee]TQE54119.1 hypothetical protein FFZ95_04750 [Leptospira borgpetersenii]AMX60272.1 hypothetical protein LBK9_01095 [Leptospira borgpetersenii serovar Hardjo]
MFWNSKRSQLKRGFPVILVFESPVLFEKHINSDLYFSACPTLFQLSRLRKNEEIGGKNLRS